MTQPAASVGGHLFTSESVTEGHPDKVCDQISDAIVDAVLATDPEPAHARVAVETLMKGGLCVLAGELRTTAPVDLVAVARQTITAIGYNAVETGFDGRTCAVLMAVEAQSPDIAHGVDAAPGHEQGAGDQGLMFGFACDETPELMPLPIALAHRLTRALAEARRSSLPWLRPDGKSQVTVRYQDGKPAGIDAVVLSAQHHADEPLEAVRVALDKLVRATLVDQDLGTAQLFLNPAGPFCLGGPAADAGLTGRKIIVDSYGGMGRHGGGAFSGKDPSKVDRSAAYLARYIAKNIVAAGLAPRCEVQLAYAIGVAAPVSLYVDTFGRCEVDPQKLAAAIPRVFPQKPADVIRELDLLRPIYRHTAAYGHFGRRDFSWERTDKVDALKAELAR